MGNVSHSENNIRLPKLCSYNTLFNLNTTIYTSPKIHQSNNIKTTFLNIITSTLDTFLISFLNKRTATTCIILDTSGRRLWEYRV